ncbi:squalene--hopene cyclase [Streptomyces sp. NPDC051976]|uniref:squalene--hopene cyclase n=1 Tax=Streptomyces sp. NPDC051976 TaxID=3154947 RepID=UPI00343994B4
MLSRGVDRLLSQQQPEGWWGDCPDANVMVDAVDLFLRILLGIEESRTVSATARWIRSQQRADGSWGLYPRSPGDLSTTVEAYLALRLAGDTPRQPHMVDAARFVRAHGGLADCRMEARLWLALFCQADWDDIPAVLPEVPLLPHRIPLSLYRFSAWTRLAMVPLGLVHCARPGMDPGFRLDELRGEDAPAAGGGAAARVQRAVRWVNAHPVPPLRRAAVRRGVQWITDRQESDGAWLACSVASVFCLLGLYAAGLTVQHPVVKAGIRGLDDVAVWEETPDGPVRRINCMPTPVWDTALSVCALTDAGVPGDHPQLVRSVRWLLGQEVRRVGDWAVARPGHGPGGWSVGFVEEHFPDCDDTALVVEALSRVAAVDASLAARSREASNRGIRWLLTMQSGDGGWAAYDADNDSWLADRLPVLDFTELTDRPCPDITGHALEALGGQGLSDDPGARRAIRWLLRNQTPEGSWFGRWGANHLYGTSAAVTALARAGRPPHDPAIRRAVAWLLRHQNPDGGWGEDLRSYQDDAWIGRGDSTPTQTSWALLALHAGGLTADDEPVARALAWLGSTQLPDGSWDEQSFNGTVLPRQFYMSYPMYRQIFPVMALGRFSHRASPTPTTPQD